MSHHKLPQTVLFFLYTLCTFTSISTQGAAINGTPNFEAAFQGKCGPSSPCVQLCIELHDGTFECQCRTGYRLLLDGYSCVEVTNTSFSEDDSEEEWMRRNAIPNTLFHEHHEQERDLKLGRLNLPGDNSISSSFPSSSAASSTGPGGSPSSSASFQGNPINHSTKSSSSSLVSQDVSTNLISNDVGGNLIPGEMRSQRQKSKSSTSAKKKNKEDFSFANIFKFSSDELPMIYGRSNYKTDTEDLIRSSARKSANRVNQDEDDDSSSSEEDSDEGGEDEDDEDDGQEEDDEEDDEDAANRKEEEEIQQLLSQLRRNVALGFEKPDGSADDSARSSKAESSLDLKPSKSSSMSSARNSINSEEEEEKNVVGEQDGSTSSSEETIISHDKLDSNQSDKPLTRPRQLLLLHEEQRDQESSRQDVRQESATISAQSLQKQQSQDGILPSLSAPSLPLPSSPISITTGPGNDEPQQPSAEPGTEAPTRIFQETTASPPPTVSDTTQEPCSVLQCQNGGLCAKDPVSELPLEDASSSRTMAASKYDGYRCLCPMGFHGEKCETEDTGDGYSSGLFRGHSWVAFPVLHDAYMSDQISIEFRPESPNGILLLTGEREDLTGDFLALYLHSGYLEFRFDCGSGSGMVRSSQPVKLQQWNRAIISRRRWDGWMQLNDGPFTQGRSKGLFSRITFRQPLFIGGSGNISVGMANSMDSGASGPGNKTGGAEPSSKNPDEVAESDMETESPAAILSGNEQQSAGVAAATESGNRDEGKKYKARNNKMPDDAEDFFAVLPFLRTMGGFKGCLRNLVINDRAYRFGLEPAGDAIQGFDVENCNDQGVCDLVHCQHGGQCIVQKDDNPICLCPLGFTGQVCETSLDLQIPSFNGSSYLKYSGLGLSRVLSWLEIEVIIKPDAADGLILYNGYKTDGMGDFISLILDQGYVEFAMDLGTGAAIIRSNNQLTLGEWHRILVSRTSRLISIKIDHQAPIMALTPGAFTQLSLPHNLFLGGIPDLQWLSPKVKVHSGFSGCIQKLIINEKPLRIMGSAMSGVNLENCAHPCLRNPCSNGGECVPQMDSFKCHCPLGYRDSYCQISMDRKNMKNAPKLIGDSYLRYTSSRIIKRISGSRLSLSFRIRTSYPRGLIIWAGRKMMTSASDFFSMGLRHGLIQAAFSLGSGQTTIAYNYTTVSDGQWHLVRFVRNEQEASLTVDDGPPVIGVAPGKLRQLNINDGLYIGGLDDPRHQSMNKYSEGLVGCITDLSIGEDYQVALLRDASEGRNVDYCDA